MEVQNVARISYSWLYEAGITKPEHFQIYSSSPGILPGACRMKVELGDSGSLTDWNLTYPTKVILACSVAQMLNQIKKTAMSVQE